MSSTLATERPAARRFRPGLWLTLSAAALLVLLVALGNWQIDRLQWKQELIAAMEAGLGRQPLPLGELTGTPAPFTRVLVEGAWRTGPPLFLGLEAHDGRPGTALVGIVEDRLGRAWLVDRGWIPDAMIPAARAAGKSQGVSVRFEAMVRQPLGRGLFTPDNAPGADRIYSEDTVLAADPALMRQVLVATSPAEPLLDGYPSPRPLRVEVKNDHLGYALTWYGLAASLLVFYVLMGFQRGAREPS